MPSPISRELEIIYRFLSTVKDNPEINKTGILARMGGTFHVISSLKDILVQAKFCKIVGANTVSSEISITQDGEQLLHYIERIMENSE